MRDAKQRINNIHVSIEQSYSELEQLYRSAPVGLCFVDTGFHFLRVNDYLAAIHGQPVEAPLGKTVREIFPTLADSVERVLNKVLDSGKESLDVDFAGKQFTDPEIDAYWRASYYPVSNDDGRILGVSIMVLDITDLRLKELALDERAQFERIISELSAMLINLPADEINRKIDDGLGLVGRFMDVDRCFINQFSEDQTEFRTTHMWTAEGIPYDELVFNVVLSNYAPWFTNQFLSGKPVIFSSTEELPVDAVFEREYVAKAGICSSAVMSLSVGGSVIGNFGFDMIKRQRLWSEDALQRLRLAGEMFTGALTRQNYQVQIEALSRFEQQIADISSGFVNIPAEQVDACIGSASRWSSSVRHWPIRSAGCLVNMGSLSPKG